MPFSLAYNLTAITSLHFYEIKSHTFNGKQNFAYSCNKLISFQNLAFDNTIRSNVICNQAQFFCIYGDKTFSLKLITGLLLNIQQIVLSLFKGMLLLSYHLTMITDRNDLIKILAGE